MPSKTMTETITKTLSLADLKPVSGGCINETFQARQADGRPVFLKTHEAPPEGFFAAEATGLQALADAGARVPEVLAQDEHYLLLEWLDIGPPQPASMAALGEHLSALHAHTGPNFGFTQDNFCGTTPQSNREMSDGHEFFIECRLLPQGELAFNQGLLGRADLRRLESLCRRLPELIPVQPPALIHGDLWSGNVVFDAQGQAVLIDPAVSWSWAEADLALTKLFGGFSAAFYQAYAAVSPLEPGFDERVPLYNLYHLLNHLNLFGGSYGSSVKRILGDF